MDQSFGRRNGFTLIEMMIVMAIIGILIATAIPGLQRMSYKTRRAEAYSVLKAINVSQLGFFGQRDAYADTFDELGFAVEGGTQTDARTIEAPYYTYTIMALDEGGVPASNYRALAIGDIDGDDPVLDILLIENNLTVVGP